jgi:signal peptidase II
MKIVNYIRLTVVAVIVIILDQWTKSLIRQLPLGATWLPEGWEGLAPYARFVHWYNTGAAFGSFQGFGWVFTLLAFVVVGFIVVYFQKVTGDIWWMQVAMGMQMGGAIGNVIDRLTNDMKVTDFISVGTFAVFNVADAAISVGTAVLLVGLYYLDNLEAKKQKLAEQSEEAIGENSVE